MKEGWEYKKLGECFISINNGANIKQIKGAKGIPITRIETLSNDKFNRGRMGYADILDASPYSSYILNDGDILMSHINSMKYLGRAVQYLKKEDETIIHGMNLLRLVPTKDVLSSFLIYQFFTAFFRNQIVSISHQSVNQASFNTTNLKNLKLKVPPLSEQQSIVDYLDSAFAKIDAMKANAEKRLNEAKALFQASLKKMLEPKEGWEEKKLKEIAQIKIGPFGSLLHKKDYISGGVPLVNPIHMVNGHIAIDNNYTISESKAKELSSYLLKENDIVFARRGEIGRCALVGEKENTYLCGTGSLFVRFNQVVDYGFMLLLFQSKYCKEYLEKQATGATMLNINSAIVGDMSIKYPHINIQQSIVATLDSLKSKVDRLQANYEKISQECDALKQAILRQVFE